LETFKDARELVEDARYPQERQEALAALNLDAIDRPIADLIAGFATLPHCFTLQCCYGHFVCAPGQDPHNLEPIARGHSGMVRYRIAYIAFCLENSPRGRALRKALARIPAIAPGYIQFGSADWFWEQWANSYALQVEPVAHRLRDEALLESGEALHTQGVRDLFFQEIRVLLAAELGRYATG
jgi:hypothetical protein